MRLLRIFRRTILRIDPNCGWCGGSGYWHGKPCIQCNPVVVDDD